MARGMKGSPWGGGGGGGGVATANEPAQKYFFVQRHKYERPHPSSLRTPAECERTMLPHFSRYLREQVWLTHSILLQGGLTREQSTLHLSKWRSVDVIFSV